MSLCLLFTLMITLLSYLNTVGQM